MNKPPSVLKGTVLTYLWILPEWGTSKYKATPTENRSWDSRGQQRKESHHNGE